MPEFHDTYRGDRWTYGLSSRPLAGFNVPDGWIIWSDRMHASFAYGVVDYSRELSAFEVSQFGLTFFAFTTADFFDR
jgi:hypothetical protein